MKKFTKEDVRKYLRMEKVFGKCPWAGMVEDETTTNLYKRYKRRYCNSSRRA